MKWYERLFAILLFSSLIIATFNMVGQNAKLSAENTRLKERINNQVEIIKEAEILVEQHKLLVEQYDILDKQYNELLENRKLLVALDPVADYFSPEELSDLIEEIGTGAVLHSPFHVTAQFGESVGYHGRYRSDHTGIDIFAQNGDPDIIPYAPGEVVVCTYDETYGKTVIIQHTKRVRTKYCHGSMIYYRADLGEYVGPNDVIMNMGDTGQADGIHLHFELQVLVGDTWTPVDPRPFLLQRTEP